MADPHEPHGGPPSGLAIHAAGGMMTELSCRGCVNLARAVLAESRLLAGRDGHDAAAWTRAAEDPGVAAWLHAVRQGVAPEAAESVPPLVRRLVAAVSPRGELSPEAAVLLDVIALVADGDVASPRFTGAVAEARLEATRELAYGAGHEINNPLANIAARAQSLLPGEPDPERRRRLSTIVDQAFRARDMIGGLMIFARPPRPRPADVPVDDLVRPAMDAVRGIAESRGVRLHYRPPPTATVAHADAGHLSEAIRLLVLNAVEAVEPGGQVVLEAVADPAGGRCAIVVSDDGPGMEPDVARRSFDPFFSGREAGRGIGLGLPKALRLVEVNAGRLVVESRRGEGTRLTVDVPLAAADAPGGAAKSSQVAAATASPT